MMRSYDVAWMDIIQFRFACESIRREIIRYYILELRSPRSSGHTLLVCLGNHRVYYYFVHIQYRTLESLLVHAKVHRNQVVVWLQVSCAAVFLYSCCCWNRKDRYALANLREADETLFFIFWKGSTDNIVVIYVSSIHVYSRTVEMRIAKNYFANCRRHPGITEHLEFCQTS